MIGLKKYFLFILVFSVITSCSTKKNTGITRTYHNLTSNYNILFNGEESYKKGQLKLQQIYDDNFSELIPVFLYTDKDQLSAIGPEMDRAIQKATKLISMHSLTVKPEYDTDQGLSDKQKEFLAKKEYNNYVDDAYLLLGKSHFHKMEYRRSKETFNYVIANFGEDYTVYESKLWLARLAILEGNYREAEDALQALNKNIELPKKLISDVHSSLADYYISQEQYSEAIAELNKAIEYENNKSSNTRYTFILAQLNNMIDQGYLASEYYGKVVRMNPPYKMAFSAKINRALSYQAGKGSSKDIEKQLRKMLRDDKNIEYQDQIYYALGKLYLKQNKPEQAIENYKLSLRASTDNIRQKAKTNLTLADLYYSKPDYINAQAYYDSAVSFIDTEYPDYNLLYAKSVSLTNLVEYIHTAEFEDSVLTLSYKPRSEIDEMIADLIEAEREAEIERQILQAELAEAQMENRNEIQSLVKTGSGFYFYNPTAKSVGKREFVSTWGNRKLEDNWRRRNKSSVDYADLEMETEGDEIETAEIIPGMLVTNKKTSEFYLQYIPFTDSAKEVSNQKIALSLYRMGEIYDDDLKDYPKATESFEKLLSRYPLYEDRLQAYYKLYQLAKNQEDINRVGKYQQKIIAEFPESNFAKLMTNPNFVQELHNRQMEVYKDFETTYALFQQGKYAQVRSRSEKAMENFPDEDLYPKYEYMYTVSNGIQKDTLSFINDLDAYQSKYPSTELAASAGILINYLKNKKPEVVLQQNTEMAKTLYEDDKEQNHFFVFALPKSLNYKQLRFNILNFNLDNFDELKLQIKRIEINNKQNLCVVEKFENAQAAREYLTRIIADEGIFRDVNSEGIIPLIITQNNYKSLINSASVEQYMLFYSINY